MKKKQEINPVIQALIIIGIKEKQKEFFELMQEHLQANPSAMVKKRSKGYFNDYYIKTAVKTLVELEQVVNTIEDADIEYIADSTIQNIYALLKPKVKKELLKFKKYEEEEIVFQEHEIWACILTKEKMPTIEEDGKALYDQYLLVRDGLVKHKFLIKENGEYKIHPDRTLAPF